MEKLIFKFLMPIVLICFSVVTYGQESYVVDSDKLNLRNGPGKNYAVIGSISKGANVEIINKLDDPWWKISFNGELGFVHSDFLKEDRYAKWEKKIYSSGEAPECSNIVPEYDKEIENYLSIKVHLGTDVVLKLMRKSESGKDVCIRIVYVRGGTSYTIENIPEGLYYIKLAYGIDWRQGIEDGKCVGKFVRNASYEIGEDILDYRLVPKGKEYYNGEWVETFEVPSFSIELGVYSDNKFSELEVEEISADDFNE